MMASLIYLQWLNLIGTWYVYNMFELKYFLQYEFAYGNRMKID